MTTETTAIAPVNGTTAPAIVEAQPSALAAATLAAEDLGMFEGLSVRPTVWQFDAKDGVFRDTEDKETGLPVLTGLIGGTWRSRCAFPPRKDSAHFAEEKDVWGEAKWFCRARRDGAEPQLNPALTPEQKALAERLGAGRSCGSCPLAQWGQDSKPRCTQFLNATWADQDTEQFGVVSVKTFSIRLLGNYISSFLKRRRLPCSQLSKLSAERKQNDDGTFYVVKAEREGEAFDSQEYARWAQAFREMDPLLRTQLEFDHQDYAETPGGNGNGSGSTDHQAPTGDTGGGGGVVLDAEGNIVDAPGGAGEFDDSLPCPY